MNNRVEVSDHLTVEQVTDIVRLLSIRWVLRPSLRPLLKYVIWDGLFGMIFQPRRRPLLSKSRVTMTT
jgi:hypothetical protein